MSYKPINKIFDWIDHIMVHKAPSSEFTEEDWAKWNSWLINKILSMTPQYLELVEFVQILPPDRKKDIYEVYKEFIPKRKVWSKYIKSKTPMPNPDLVLAIKTYYKCSLKEAGDYVKLLTKEHIEEILTQLSFEDKEIKKLIKTL